MHTYLRNKPVWLQIMIFGGLTIGFLMVSMIVGLSIVSRIYHMSFMQIANLTPADYAKPGMIGVIRGLLFVQFGIFFLPAIIFAYLADPHPLNYAGLRPTQKNSFYIVAFFVMIIAYFTVELFGMINESIVHVLPSSTQAWIMKGENDANATLSNILAMKTGKDLLITIFLVGALAAIGEEIFFRGILQKLFIQVFKQPWAGIIFTAFLFSAIHMQFMGFLPRMALGIILGALYWYSGSLLTSILGHFVFNTINILLIYFRISDMDTPTTPGLAYSIVGLVSLALVIILLNYMRKKSITDYATEFPPRREIDIFDEPDQRA